MVKNYFNLKEMYYYLKKFSLDPSDSDIIEDVWKPNDSFIGRKIFSLFDKYHKVQTN